MPSLKNKLWKYLYFMLTSCQHFKNRGINKYRIKYVRRNQNSFNLTMNHFRVSGNKEGNNLICIYLRFVFLTLFNPFVPGVH